MRKLTLIFVVSICLSMLTGGLQAQEIKFPKVSQKAMVSQAIGLTDVTVTFHRPGVKGRTIWGDLVPYNEVWRTGANEATTIEFSSDVMIEGKKLAAGKYGLFTIPTETEWTVIFSKQADIWGSMGYKEEEDALRIKVKPAEASHCEWLMFVFGDLKEDSAKLMMRWEKVMIAFTISVDTKGAIVNDINKAMARYWVSPYSAANYAFENDMIDKAKEYVDLSVAIKPMYWNMFLKAKIYKKLAKTKKEMKDAVKILEEAVKLIDQLPERQQKYAEEGKKLLEEWKKK